MRAWLSLSCLVLACGASRPQLDGGATDGGAGNDVNLSGDAPKSLATFPNLIFVNGLVNGATVDTQGLALDLSDVRVCIAVQKSNHILTKYAMPDDVPIPLTNYPGVHRGGGADLGSMQVTETDFVVHVFRATDLQNDAAWLVDRTQSCQALLSCPGAGCLPHRSLPLSLTADVNVVALVDQTGDGGADVTLKSSGYDATPFSGAPDSLHGGVVSFAGWHAGAKNNAYFTTSDGSGAIVPMADPLPDDAAFAPVLLTSKVTSYEGLGVRFNELVGQQQSDTFWQSLDSIAFVTNQAIDPPTFYGARKSFVFALIGDPGDVTSVLKNGGRDPQFDGRGLHVVAVPYADPTPKP